MQLVRSLAHHEAACLMVCRDDDDRLVGMLLIEFVSHFYGLVQIENLVDDIAYVVAVAGIVDHASFNLEEETVLVLVAQIVDAGSYDLLQRKVVAVLVKGVRDVVAFQLLILIVAL